MELERLGRSIPEIRVADMNVALWVTRRNVGHPHSQPPPKRWIKAESGKWFEARR